MIKILDFNSNFCLRRRRINIRGRNFIIIAGHKKKEAETISTKEAIEGDGCLVGDGWIYGIPSKKGRYKIKDMVFLVSDLGVWCDII